MNTELIDYFKVGIKTNDTIKSVDFETINKKSIKLGWIIHPYFHIKLKRARSNH